MLSHSNCTKIITIILALTIFAATLSAQKIGEKVLKEVTVNGEKVERWVKLVNFWGYDSRGNMTIYKDSFRTEYSEYDANGNLTYRLSGHYELWKEYDSDEKIIHEKDSNGNESWYEYTYYPNGKNVHTKICSTSGSGAVFEYDLSNNLLHYTNNGYEIRNEYDSKGNKTYTNTNGKEEWWEYDSNSNIIYYKHTNGKKEWFDYDSIGNLIYHKKQDNYFSYEEWTEYDSNRNKVHTKDSTGGEFWYEYDTVGNQIYLKDNNGFEYWYEYNSKNDKIHYKGSSGAEGWYEYTYYPDGTIKTKAEYRPI